MELVGSDILKIEMANATVSSRRQGLQKIYDASISSGVSLTDSIKGRAKEIQSVSSIKSFDSLHLASAEANADILLTTDQRFLNAAKRIGDLSVRVENPVFFVMEAMAND